MTRAPVAALALATAALTTVGCGSRFEPGELTAEQSVALEAGIESLAPMRAALPIRDDALRGLGTRFVLQSEADESCPQRGIVAGLWLESDGAQRIVGAWFAIGSGELGGSIAGGYANGQYEGTVDGPDIHGVVEGPYAERRFDGSWHAAIGSDGANHEGELLGRYERRNELGGYFFGVWSDCTADE